MKRPIRRLAGFCAAIVLAATANITTALDTQVITDFRGPAEDETWWWPEDPNAAVGPNHVMVVINGIYRIYTKSGTLVGSGNLDTIFAPANASIASLDPNITYDDIAQRFVIEVNGSGTDIVSAYVAVSNTSDPTQGFTDVHKISFPGAWDGSKLGFNADAYVVIATTGVAVINKASVLDANRSTFTITSQTTSTYGRAARMHGATPGMPMYFTAGGTGGTVKVTRMDNVLSATPVYTSYNVTGTTGCTDPATPAWRNNSLVTANTGTMYWWQINTSGATPSLTQQGLVNPPSGYQLAYGSANIAPNGDMGMSFMQYSSSTTVARPVSMWVAWRAAGDPAGTMRTPVMTITSDPLTQVGGRHGDYSSTVSDIDSNGNTLNTFWACNGYIKPNTSGGAWEACWMQHFGGPLTAPSIATQPASQVVEEGGSVTFSVTATGAAPFTYQWRKNGVNIPSATGKTHTIASATMADAGDYSVAVVNSLGNITSANGTLTVVDRLTPTGDWKFDEGTGTVATDSSPFGYNGTINGATWTTGYQGQALQFNGVSSWVTFGTAPSVSGTNSFTVSAWIRTTAATAGVIVQQRDAGGFNGQYKFNMNANGTLHFMVYGEGAYQFDFNTTQAINDGAWHHVVAVRSGLSGYIYIDGNPTPAASATGTAVRTILSTISTAVGRDVRDSVQNFNGAIDEVRLYRKTGMTGSEVAALYASYTGGPTPPPAPTGLTATPGNAQVALAWSASAGATSYNVKRSTVSGGPYTTIAPGVTATSHTDTTVVNGTTYYYVVSAVNADGESANSAQVSARPTLPPTIYYPGSYAVSRGTYSSGTVGSLTGNDNNYLVIASTTSGTRYATTDLTVTGIAGSTPSQVSVQVTAKSSQNSTTQAILLWNYTTSAWDSKDSATIGTAESTRTFNVTSGASNYISGGQLKVRTDASKSNKNYNHSLEVVSVTVTQ